MLFPSPKQSSAPSRVVITGAGIITAHGNGWGTNAQQFRAGETAFRPITVFDPSRQRIKTAAEVSLPEALPTTRLSPREERRLDRASRLLLLATAAAWQQAGWEPSEHLPFVLGTTSGGMGMGEIYYRQATAAPLAKRNQASRVFQYQAQLQADEVARAFGFRGPSTIIANACASGANAVGHAFSLIRQAQAERVLTGGYDALSQMVFAGFDSLQALSPTRCRPFDAHRDGLALGEGAAILALESLGSAKKRGAEILGEIAGYGCATDAHHLTQPHPQGDAAFQTMTSACAVAGIQPHQVGYVNAHGTGTPLNDSAEAAAINRWAGTGAGKVWVSSTKAGIGHLLGAAGAVETVVCLMALREQWLPPNLTVETPDPVCRFPLVRKAMDGGFDFALTNSFGFGGANASLLLRRWV